MEKTEVLKILRASAQLDIDTVHSYNRVLDEISDEIIRSRLTSFRDDHLNHIAALADEIRTLGGEAPQMSKDVKGYVIETFAILRAKVGGMKSAMEALKTTEEITNRHYGQIVSKDVTPPLKDLLRRHFSNEKIHLRYINDNLKAL
jgi:hypothetical protein